MSKSTLKWVITVAAVVTAVVHLALGLGGLFGGSPGGLDYAFVLNGIGFFGLVAALFFVNVPVLSQNETLTHYLLIAFAAVTFVLYFVFNGFSFGPAAIVSKAAELVLIVATFMHLNR